MEVNKVYQGDCVQVMQQFPIESIDMCLTSPPYWGLRDYGHDGQYGLEKTPEEYIEQMTSVFHQVKRILKKEGTLWLNLGDTYGGGSGGYYPHEGEVGAAKNQIKFKGADKPKCLLMIPERVAWSLIQDGWILRNKIIWYKPNGMPSSVTDRFSNKWEHLFMFSRSQKYYFDLDAVREEYTEPMNRWGGDKLMAKGRSVWDKGTGQESYRDRDMRPHPDGKNPGDVFKIPTQPFPEAHFAVFPPKLCEKPIKAGCPVGGIVLDPFCGAGTTLYVAQEMKRNYIGIDINQKFIDMAEKRTAQRVL